jgi:uncharacterized delta-60 repeat protein
MNYKKLRTVISLIFSLTLIAALLSGDLLRTSAAGDQLDITFHGNGKLATDFSSRNDIGHAVAVQADGKIVVVGESDGEVALTRYNPNGSLDTTFSGDGRVLTGLAGRAYAVAIQPDGKIVVAGRVDVNFMGRFLVARYLTSGSPDNSFNGNGSIVVEFPGGGVTLAGASCIAIQPNGYIVVAGTKTDSDLTNSWRRWAIARFAPSGLLDPLFDNDGRVETNFGSAPSALEGASAITILSDGKILIAGTSSPSSNSNFTLARYNTNGSLDTSFDTDGKVVVDFGANEQINDMKLQADGKIVVAGTSGTASVRHFAVGRFNATGTPDTSFDLDGIALTNINPAGNDVANELVIQADGKIVLAGTKFTGTGPGDYVLARYLQNGSLDSGFGQAGIVTTDLNNNSDDEANGIALQSDGKLVVAGMTRNTGTTHDNFSAARYLPGGATQFDFDGDSKTDLGIFRPSNAQWWINRSSNSSTFATQFGATTDRIAPADYTGDGKTDIAIWRPSTGTWFVLRSEDFSFYAFPFGTKGDIPAADDYDNDGRADAAIFRPSNATWFIQRSTGGTTIQQFGTNGDVPVVADYDGDGRADLAIYRPSLGQWWLNRSTAGVIAVTFGVSTDKAVQGDYTGDGKADVAFWRPSTGSWFILRSEDLSFFSFPLGISTDIPAPGDYDGDGRHDATVFRPSNATWFSQRTTAGTLIQQFGTSGDRPIPNSFVP